MSRSHFFLNHNFGRRQNHEGNCKLDTCTYPTDWMNAELFYTNPAIFMQKLYRRHQIWSLTCVHPNTNVGHRLTSVWAFGWYSLKDFKILIPTGLDPIRQYHVNTPQNSLMALIWWSECMTILQTLKQTTKPNYSH